MSGTIDLAVIPGDGIGEEVTAAALKIADQVAGDAHLNLQPHYYDWGATRYLKDGQILPADELADLRHRHAIVLGAIGDPRVAPGILERGLLLTLRFELDHYVNLRPARTYPGIPSPLANPADLDLVVVREGTEGLYCGNGGAVRVGTSHEIATETSINTAFGVRRVVEYAFSLAAKRRRKITLIHKQNVLVHAGKLWQRIVNDVAANYTDVEVEYHHIDAATIYLVTDPERYDVIVTDNLFGDIITDLIGAVTGGIGFAPSANLNPQGQTPSMFEPVHGSAPDIAGAGLADPVAAIASIALMYSHLGYDTLARRIDLAISEHMTRRTNGALPATTTTAITDDLLRVLKHQD